MLPFANCPAARLASVRYWMTDIDDTLTDEGLLGPDAYAALWDLHHAGIAVIPVTGRPAGWCDMIARFWPVAAVVGENGAFYMRYDRAGRRMITHHWQSATERVATRKKLHELRHLILSAVPGAGVASDQDYRLADLAIDFCEDVPRLAPADVQTIVDLFTGAGATAKVSSIHVNGWFGDWDKLKMTRRLMAQEFGVDIDREQGQMIFSGDSPNDQPMFAFFDLSLGVANVADFALEQPPRYVTTARGGAGFAEAVQIFLNRR